MKKDIGQHNVQNQKFWINIIENASYVNSLAMQQKIVQIIVEEIIHTESKLIKCWKEVNLIGQ